MYRLPLHYTYIIRTCYIRHTLIVIHCTFVHLYVWIYTNIHANTHTHNFLKNFKIVLHLTYKDNI